MSAEEAPTAVGGSSATKRAVEGDGYVNVGLQRWEKLRADWKSGAAGGASGDAGGGKVPARPQPRGEVRAKSIDVEDVIERIFSQTGKGLLPEPIPLGQMIDILVDFWESEGLLD